MSTNINHDNIDHHNSNHNHFELHPQLAKDSFSITKLSLCEVRLINDRQFPWIILVPQRVDISEIYQLEAEDIKQLNTESLSVSELLMQHFKGDKLNVAALGNVVPQLHIHHIVRFESDIAWPAPVWGKQAMQPYSEQKREDTLTELSELFSSIS